MILTVEEAKTKWCPKYQVSASSGGMLTNRAEDYFNEMNCNCIADHCMAWRWAKRGVLGYTRAMPDCPKCHGEGRYDGTFTDIDGRREDVVYHCECYKNTHVEKIFGYCGLVGNQRE